ncbi:MAG: YggT family protein [Aestuariivirgaceae bacterium]
MNSILWLVLTILDLYFWIIIAVVVMSWLIGFNIINPSNQFVRQLRYGLHRLTEPLLGPIRRLLPDLGGLDISPIILILGLFFLQRLIIEYGTQLL